MMNLTEEILEISNPRATLKLLSYDMREIHKAESRVHEIALVSASKAPELMSIFSAACFKLGRHMADLNLQHRLAKKRVGDRRAILIIDVIPEKLKEKNLAANEATRQAFLDRDPEYSDAAVGEAETESALIYIERKLRDMEGALNAVKRAADINIHFRPNPNLSTGGFEDEEFASQLEETRKQMHAVSIATNGVKIGSVKY